MWSMLDQIGPASQPRTLWRPPRGYRPISVESSIESRRSRALRTHSKRWLIGGVLAVALLAVGSAVGAAPTGTVDGTHQATATLTATRNGAAIDIAGSIPITFADYGVTAPTIGGFVTVDPAGQIEFLVTLAASRRVPVGCISNRTATGGSRVGSSVWPTSWTRSRACPPPACSSSRG
ncbi:hypothetical protein [Pseudonocardia sp. GCM10023141]|uniref:hypothetical protein n=1 Tax=Pseudonocardia sp. GCM10023141 TaxID=3252653 RepID=UPI003618FFE7